MARLNTHLSATPQPQTGRSSTVDSLYRDATPMSLRSALRGSTYSVLSPARSFGSDKENDIPNSRDNTSVLPPRSKRPMSRSVHPPTPPSDSSSSRQSNKRRRTDEHSAANRVQIYQDEEVEDEDELVLLEQRVVDRDEAVSAQEYDTTKYYDPQQDPDIRRQLRANMRNHQREIEDNRAELIKPGNNQLLDHLKRQDYYMGKVKQTSDAALDSRVMVLASDLASKKLNNTLHGNSDVGIDVDQFVSRVIHFMKSGGHPDEEELAANVGDDEQEEDVGDGLDWALLGNEACFSCNKRPPAPSFLLGPLSVEKRVRVTQRRARSQRQPVGPATRPQELTRDDIRQSENTNLTYLVKNIKTRLENHINKGEENVQEELDTIEGEPREKDFLAAMKRHRIEQTPNEEAAVSLFEFIINPHSFGQTVENLFYVSFLIREGNVKMIDDEHGLPLLVPAKPHSIDEQREHNVQKHQAVFSIDYETWDKLIRAFSIQEPIIPHRIAEETNVTAGGWYG